MALFSEFLGKCRQSRKVVLLVVYIALFVDFMLLTTVVPIIPTFLYSLKHPSRPASVPGGNAVEHLAPNSGDIHLFSENGSDFYHNSSRSPDTYEKQILSQQQHEDFINGDMEVGFMLASKAIVQLIVNPFVGPLTNRIGYSIPMIVGIIATIASTVVFAFGETYAVLIVARAVQGIGSSCASVAGMGMLASCYPDDRERGNAMGIALGGIALGVLAGPVFGGVMYEVAGKEAPFLILAGLAVLDGILMTLILQPSVQHEPEVGAPLLELLRDPYILIIVGSITLANAATAMLEASLPAWMMSTMNAPTWQQGVAFLPASITYLIGTNLFGPLAFKMGRWLFSLIGMLLAGISLFALPFVKNIFELIPTNCGIGFALGMVDAAMIPHMGYLVDLRHVSVYGSAYAIVDVSLCLGYAAGPILSGALIKALDFRWMLWMVALLNVLYSPVMLFLRNPPGKEEKMAIIQKEKISTQ